MTHHHALRALRIWRGVKVKELAEKAGIGESTLRRYENGQGNMSLEYVMFLATALGVHWIYICAPDWCMEKYIDADAAMALMEAKSE